MTDYLNIYGEQFFKRRKKFSEEQRAVGGLLQRELQLRSVVDFGCGIGTLIQGMRDGGCTILGVEHSVQLARRYSPIPEKLVAGDVTKPLSLGRHDWSMCIEVAEHVPPTASAQLVANLASHCIRGVIFSAAVPGQKGIGHINCQPPEVWQDLFHSHRLDYSRELTDRLRKLVAPFTQLPWLKQNLMIFQSGGFGEAFGVAANLSSSPK